MLNEFEEDGTLQTNLKLSNKIIISKKTAAIYVVSTILTIVTVGLLCGLLSQYEPHPLAPIVCDEKTTQSVVTTKTTTPPTTLHPPGIWNNIRLPRTLIPSHYMVDLQADLEPDSSGQYWFNGTSEVTFTAMEDTNILLVHSYKLDFSLVNVYDDQTSKEISYSEYWFHLENQYMIIELQEEMTLGNNYTLKTQYRAELENSLAGFYRSTYTKDDGTEIVIAVSQMVSSEARKVFPCFDEPEWKATFDVYLWYKEPYFAQSNMPINSTEVRHDDWFRTKFQRSVPMSTYLVTFVISDFESVTTSTHQMPITEIGIYARSSQITAGNADYALSITGPILEHFTTYFQVAYPLPKLDLVAVSDFPFQAMENWGIIIYRETALLFDEKVNSAADKQNLAAVVSHEISHQWFGNLVTTLWWDEVWLNEGFASYIEYIGIELVEPEFYVLDQYIILNLHEVMNVDSLTTSHPIVPSEVNTIEEINAMFDTISYDKGACIIRMINYFMGDEAFKLGLMNYLTAFAYGPVEHEAFFHYWEQAANETDEALIPPSGFANAMNTWVLQMGYPVVDMKRGTTKKVIITQKRFLIDPEADSTFPESDFKYKWEIPLWYKLNNEQNKTLLWMQPDEELSISVPIDDFYIGNYEALGYYRVNYDISNWRKIINTLNTDHGKIEVKSRGQLINDAFNLARSGQLNYNITLSTTTFLVTDFNYIVWQSALDVLEYFDRMLGRSKAYGVYSKYIAHLVGPVYNNLTWEDKGKHLEKLQRVNAVKISCTYGNKNCVKEANQQFQNWKSNTTTSTISPDLRSIVYCQGISDGNSDDWDFVWSKYQVEIDALEKNKLLTALSCTKEPWIIRRYLDYTLNPDLIKKQDASYVYGELCGNEQARDITWNYLRENWDYIYTVYGTGLFAFSSIIDACTSHFSTTFELKELEEFKEENIEKLGSGARSVEQAIETTNTNIQWRKDNEDIIFNWLADYVSKITI